eukprot:sb/3478610/
MRLLLCLLLLSPVLVRASDEWPHFKVAAIVENMGDGSDDSWPRLANETLIVAKNLIKDRLGISLDLRFVFSKCNTKIGLIETTKCLIDQNLVENDSETE